MTTSPCRLIHLAVLVASLAGCDRDTRAPAQTKTPHPAAATTRASQPAVPRRPRTYRVAHVFVALCDNRHQGIAPVPAAIGNGQDPDNNLYWGALYGLRTFLRRSPHWRAVTLASHQKNAKRPGVLRRAVFRHQAALRSVYVVADAYDGSKMTLALTDFFRAAAGADPQEVPTSAQPIQAGGYADLVCFVGHNGLMEAPLPSYPRRGRRTGPAAAVVLACQSQAYFTAGLKLAACPPLLTTRGNMCPEAYTLDAALRSWSAGDTPAATHRKAAAAYAKYQKCSLRAALGLFAENAQR